MIVRKASQQKEPAGIDRGGPSHPENKGHEEDDAGLSGGRYVLRGT